ncbi:MAG: hypothetical protein V4513_09420 [Pseudomonadota bacterium]
MVRSVTLGFAMIALAMSSSAAFAQVVGGAGPEAGSGNAAQSSAASRDAQASYNRMVGSIDPVKAAPSGIKGKTRPAVAADFKVGSPLRDISGVPIGAVAAVEQDGVVVDTGKARIKVPAVAFGKDELGLMLGISAAKFAALVAKAHASN